MMDKLDMKGSTEGMVLVHRMMEVKEFWGLAMQEHGSQHMPHVFKK